MLLSRSVLFGKLGLLPGRSLFISSPFPCNGCSIDMFAKDCVGRFETCPYIAPPACRFPADYLVFGQEQEATTNKKW